jgi:hypothetical protein
VQEEYEELTMQVNMVLNEILDVKDISSLMEGKNDETVIKQLYQLVFKTAKTGELHSVRAHELDAKTKEHKTNPMWITCVHTDKKGIACVYSVHLMSVFRLLQVKNEWVSRDRGRKFAFNRRLPYDTLEHGEGCTLWIGGVIVYTSLSGTAVVARIVELRQLPLPPTEASSPAQTPTETANVPLPHPPSVATSPAETPTETAPISKHEKSKRRKLAAKKAKEDKITIFVPECKDGPRIRMTCRLFKRQSPDSCMFELKGFYHEEDILTTAVLAFSNHAGLGVIPTSSSTIRLTNDVINLLE